MLSFTLLAAFLWAVSGVSAAEPGAAKGELDELVAAVTEKIKVGQRTEADLTEEIAGFDQLLAKYSDQKTDEVAQILVMKALLYLQVFEEPEPAMAMFRQLQADFPGTEAADKAVDIVASLEMRTALAEGKSFPGFEAEDLEGQPLSLEDYAGKVVLVDFWATWCGPCVAELPHVLAAYEAHHDAGFEILGISLDSDEKKLRSFMQKNNMSWRQYFDGKGWKNELAQKFGVNSIPATFLLDADGVIIGKDLRGPALAEAVAAALKR